MPMTPLLFLKVVFRVFFLNKKIVIQILSVELNVDHYLTESMLLTDSYSFSHLFCLLEHNIAKLKTKSRRQITSIFLKILQVAQANVHVEQKITT